MAESFYGKDLTIHFTNGGGEGLFQALVMLGRELPEEKTLRELIDYLQYSLDNFGYGCRFFSLQDLPDELNHEHLAEFARLINLLCIEMTKAESKIEPCGLAWSQYSRMNFLARLTNLYSEIGNILSEHSIVLEPQNIPLLPEEKISVERQKLSTVYDQTKNRLSKEEKLNLWERIVELSEQDTISMSLEVLSLTYLAYIELIDDSFPQEKADKIWQRFLEIELQIGDEESIKLAKEILEGM